MDVVEWQSAAFAEGARRSVAVASFDVELGKERPGFVTSVVAAGRHPAVVAVTERRLGPYSSSRHLDAAAAVGRAFAGPAVAAQRHSLAAALPNSPAAAYSAPVGPAPSWHYSSSSSPTRCAR